MRRSVREAIVGFSLLAAISSAVGLSFWLRGISISRTNWTVQADFDQARGLAERSAVVYRGVQIGNVCHPPNLACPEPRRKGCWGHEQ